MFEGLRSFFKNRIPSQEERSKMGLGEQIIHPAKTVLKDVFSGAGKGIQDLSQRVRSLDISPNYGNNLIKPFQMVAESDRRRAKAGGAVKNFLSDEFNEIGTFLSSIGDKGFRSTVSDIASVPGKFKSEGFFESLGTPEATTAFGALNLIPGMGTLDDISDAVKPLKSVDEAADAAKQVSKLRSGGFYRKFENTGVGEVVSKAVRSTLGFIERQGERGKQISRLIQKANEEGALKAGQAVSEMQNALEGLSPQGRSTLAEVIEGTKNPISEVQAHAANVWKRLAKEVADEAQALDLKIKSAEGISKPFEALENYFPRKLLPKAMKELESSGKLSRGAIRRFGNLEIERTLREIGNSDAFIRDPEVLLDYLENAHKRLADYKFFGRNDKALYDLAEELPKGTTVKQMLDRILGKEGFNPTERNVSRGLRKFQAFKLDPASTIQNLGQTISTAIYTNPKVTARAIADRFLDKKGSRDLAVKAGELLPEALRDYYSEIFGTASKEALSSKYLGLIKFDASENLNRAVAVRAGYRHAEDLYKKLLKSPDNGAVRRALADLGLDADELLKRGITEQDKIKAGRNVAQTTQFSTNPEDLPYFWSSDWGRVFTQFKSFSFKQAEFLKNQLKRDLREAKKGNFKSIASTLTTAGIGGGVLGEVITDIKMILRGENPLNRGDEEELLERYINNVLSVVSLGLFSDVTNFVTNKYGDRGAIGFLGGPTVSDAMDVKDIISPPLQKGSVEDRIDAIKDESIPRALEFGTERIPVVGRALDEHFFDKRKRGLRSVKGEGDLKNAGTGRYAR